MESEKNGGHGSEIPRFQLTVGSWYYLFELNIEDCRYSPFDVKAGS